MARVPSLSFPSFPSASVRAPAWLCGVAALALAACSGVPGQKADVPQPPAPQQAAQSSSPSPSQAQPAGPQAAPNPALQALLSQSDATLQLIESQRMDALWATTAPFVQASVPRAQLEQGVRRARATLGTVQSRRRAGVQPVQFGAESKSPPPGQYANVLYQAQLAGQQRGVERLSFRQEGARWLFTGYTAQLLQPPAAAPAAGAPAAPAAPAAVRR